MLNSAYTTSLKNLYNQNRTLNSDLITIHNLINSQGTLVRITNFGAIITHFFVPDRSGNLIDIVLGFDTVGDYSKESYLDNYPWFGAAIGRYANRIKNASFSIDEKEYKLTANNGNNQLHGGFSGFDKKIWKVIGKESNSLELTYTSVDGEEGYPGNCKVTLRFELTENNELSYEFTATTDHPTPVNLTHHDYFNLDGKGNIATHLFKIHSNEMLEQDQHVVANGNILPVIDSVYDFTNFKTPDEKSLLSGNYDISYVSNKKSTLLAEARSLTSGIGLKVFSDAPVVHFYAGKWIPEVVGKDGNLYEPFSGFCFETQVHPNAVNVGHFPNTILNPGETYSLKTIYQVAISDDE